MINKTMIITVNWNGWRDTLKCLESLQRLDHHDFEVVVVDNGSTNNSVERIREWGTTTSSVMMREYKQTEIHDDDYRCLPDYHGLRLTFILSDINLGYSGGNNIGIEYALKRGVRYVWLLNNDTIVEPNSLSKLEYFASVANDRILLSSRIVYMHNTESCWFEGGIYNPWFASTKSVSINKFSVSKYQFLTGCALLIPVRVIKEIGRLDEDIFLYAEDVDYSIRATRAGILLNVVTDSKVMHVGSASSEIGSPQAYYMHVMNLVRVIRKHYGKYRLFCIIPYYLVKLIFLVLSFKRPFSIIKPYLTGLYHGSTDLVVDK